MTWVPTKVCLFVIGATIAVPASSQTTNQSAMPSAQPAKSLETKFPHVRAKEKVASAWSQSEIELAQARCVHVLRGLDIVAIPATPVRDGDCGAPAPIELVSIGKSPQVTFSPPVTVTCDLAATMHNWIRAELQPIAKRHLGADVIRIDTMSSYSCRNAYGRTKNRLSEHGKANAIDIRGFMTAKSDYAEVLTDWGPTARDIQAQVAMAKANAEKAERQRAIEIAAARAKGAAPAATQSAATESPVGQVGTSSVQTATIPDMRPSISVGGTGAGLPRLPGSDTGLGWSAWPGQPSRLGGPKPGGDAVEPRGADKQKYTRFLRAVHASACKTFGTTLGPESNEAHRNHFHFDLAERTTTNFCE
jgi:hypothetical protein